MPLLRPALAALVAAAPCCPSTNCPECECAPKEVRFELTGDGNSLEIFDASGTKVSGIEADLSSCSCAERVKIVMRHRDGASLQPPPEGPCIIDRSENPASEVWFTAKVGAACEASWRPRDSSPTIVFPIKVRP